MNSQHDDAVRSRIAEIRAAAGVPHAQVSMEVMYFLPRRFIEAYGHMFTRAVKSDAGESSRHDAQIDGARVGKTAVRKTGAGPTIQGGGKRYKKSFVVKDEVALDAKHMIDKRLRQIAREIETLLAGGDSMGDGRGGRAEPTRCGSCGIITKPEWRYCPRDGFDLGMMRAETAETADTDRVDEG